MGGKRKGNMRLLPDGAQKKQEGYCATAIFKLNYNDSESEKVQGVSVEQSCS